MTQDCEQVRMTIGQNFTCPALLNCDFAINKPDFKMSQTCKVCGEPAAGFHFGAFTCEGCKSFFGRSYNNINAINDCKNNNHCIINKKNRTACKSCRLRKCLMVGMSKSGSRYGRRSNWFKIHCLLQEQQQQKHLQENGGEEPTNADIAPPQITPPPPPASHPQMNMRLFGASGFAPSLLQLHQRAREEMMYSFDEPFRPSASPSVSSPESHNSDSSIEVTDGRRMPLVPGLISSAAFLHSQNLLFPYPPFYHGVLSSLPQTAHYNRSVTANNNNNIERAEHLPVARREYLEAVLQMQQRQHEISPATEERRNEEVEEEEEEEVEVQLSDPMSPAQEMPIDLSVRSERGSSPATSERSGVSMSTERGNGSDGDEESLFEAHNKAVRTIPLDLRRK